MPADGACGASFVLSTPLTQDEVTIYVSWNGATSVARWQVLARDGGGRRAAVATAPDRGFETRIVVRSSAHSFDLLALGAGGQLLGRSAPLTPVSPAGPSRRRTS